MRLDLTDQAREYIRAHGGHALIITTTPHGCCGGTGAPMLQIGTGRPAKDPGEYLHFEEGGAAVHVPNELNHLPRLSVSLKQFLWFRALVVTGPDEVEVRQE